MSWTPEVVVLAISTVCFSRTGIMIVPVASCQAPVQHSPGVSIEVSVFVSLVGEELKLSFMSFVWV